MPKGTHLLVPLSKELQVRGPQFLLEYVKDNIVPSLGFSSIENKLAGDKLPHEIQFERFDLRESARDGAVRGKFPSRFMFTANEVCTLLAWIVYSEKAPTEGGASKVFYATLDDAPYCFTLGFLTRNWRIALWMCDKPENSMDPWDEWKAGTTFYVCRHSTRGRRPKVSEYLLS